MLFHWPLTRQLHHAFQLNCGRLLVAPSLQSYSKFYSSAFRATEDSTHYDTLNLPYNATAAEIKRRYYELSKAHHPDRNPKDPGAAARFALISDAYAVIGNTVKREKYDRDLARSHGIRHQRPSGPAGGRPASGLSRRRTQFHGPPPSFFRNGGLGRATRASQARTAGGVGGFGIGGAQSGRNDDVPHFDFERHRAQQERRRRPMTQKEFDFATSGIIVPMLGIASLLIVAVAIASRDSKPVDARKHGSDTTQ
ncbi:hypothetical protein BGX38DRAFT_323072 [Terfezia claveryi]|nr:hypothetical protein BGX38DRAFT_323072 [Terfezia claveryi]